MIMEMATYLILKGMYTYTQNWHKQASKWTVGYESATLFLSQSGYKF